VTRIDGKLVNRFVSVGEVVSVLSRKTHRLPALDRSAVETIRGLNAEQQRGGKNDLGIYSLLQKYIMLSKWSWMDPAAWANMLFCRYHTSLNAVMHRVSLHM
jgi:hypothetical protein